MQAANVTCIRYVVDHMVRCTMEVVVLLALSLVTVSAIGLAGLLVPLADLLTAKVAPTGSVRPDLRPDTAFRTAL